MEEGTINISAALKIAEQFHLSRQFWSYLFKERHIDGVPQDFINSTPHMSFCHGEKDVDYLRRRHELLKKEPLFENMVYTTDPEQIGEWAPLLTKGRSMGEKIAATRVARGTDCNFGVLTKKLVRAFEANGGLTRYNTEVLSIAKEGDG